MMVVTCTQAVRQLQEDVATHTKEPESGAEPHTMVDVPGESVNVGGEFDPTKYQERERKSCRQHWKITRQNSTCTPESTGVSVVICTHVEGASKMDTSLSKVHQPPNGDADYVIDKSYYWHNGFLYHQWKPYRQGAKRVISHNLFCQNNVTRGKVLSLAHSIPLAGHLGKEEQDRRSCSISTGPPC